MLNKSQQAHSHTDGLGRLIWSLVRCYLLLTLEYIRDIDLLLKCRLELSLDVLPVNRCRRLNRVDLCLSAFISLSQVLEQILHYFSSILFVSTIKYLEDQLAVIWYFLLQSGTFRRFYKLFTGNMSSKEYMKYILGTIMNYIMLETQNLNYTLILSLKVTSMWCIKLTTISSIAVKPSNQRTYFPHEQPLYFAYTQLRITILTQFIQNRS